MPRYLLRRLVQAVPLLVLVSLGAFVIMRLAPGGPTAVYANNPYVSAEDLARLETALGLDRPLHIQYAKWLAGMVRGEWGYSYQTGEPVTREIMARVPATVLLTGLAFAFTVALGVPLGVFLATRRNSLVDYAAGGMSMLFQSVPTFWLGIMAIFVLGVQLRIVPTGGIATLGATYSLSDRLWHAVTPSLVLASVTVAMWSRYMRSSMLDVIQRDYIRTAQAKGLAPRRVLLVHALRNAMLPIITLAGLHLPQMFSGALVTETVFAWPGIGRLYYDALNARDYPLLLGILLIVSILVVVGSALADVGYALVDPRIRLGARAADR